MTQSAQSPVAAALIAWHARGGRHDLPWQQEPTPYRVWVSEIMLQQTQVATVMRYFGRFIERFPDVRALADAPLDEVLHLWSGLGYYARARNLHRAAQCVRDRFGGEFPSSFEDMESLPGIGRSTAGAILALSRNERHAILDGNVKRVLARCFGVAGNPMQRAVEAQLWQLAERCTPARSAGTYTQAIMDLGATLCTRARPRCAQCPLTDLCFARHSGRQHELPTPRPSTPRALRRSKRTIMLVAMRADRSVLLEKRPPHGIWGGLWCLPEFSSEAAARSFALQHLQQPRVARELMAQVQHSFTHFDLAITPLLAECVDIGGVMEGSERLWYNIRAPANIGLPAPIRSLLDELGRPVLIDSPS
ncbi:MAG TPA: A/G-specific adenine glycosylase [Steroidobacteraceae bacterium]